MVMHQSIHQLITQMKEYKMKIVGKLNSPFAVAVFSGKEASFKEYQSFTLGDKNVFTLDGESKFLCTNIFLFVSHVAHYSALHQYPSNTT